MTKLNQSIVLADGRRLGYDEYGPSNGKPLFYFHGTPSSRKDWSALGNAGLPEKLGVRVISADRPGMGLSDFQPGRRMGDWPADVAAMAEALGIERFAVLGYSGGRPCVAACPGWCDPSFTCVDRPRLGSCLWADFFNPIYARLELASNTLRSNRYE